MKTVHLSVAMLAAGLLAGGAQAAVTGDYVESRSANIFVGACHHEGEIQTAGRNAVLAWNITGGDHRGVDLKGVSVVAVVASDKHLSFADAKRKSVLYVSDRATATQRDAVVSLLKERAGAAIGDVLEVKAAPVQFDGSGSKFRVNVAGVATMQIRKEVAELCCKQPYEFWGKPFIQVKAAKAGYCEDVRYKDGVLLQSWSATDQNNAFFGQFSL